VERFFDIITAMKSTTNWKLLFGLLVASVIAGLGIMPYALSLNPVIAEAYTPTLLVAQIIQTFIIFFIAIFFGLRLAKRVGFGLPILEGISRGEKKCDYLKSILGKSVGWGVLAAVIIILLSFFWPTVSVSFLKLEVAMPVWKLLLTPFYGGIGEEVLLRLFMMTFFVWIAFKIRKTAEGLPTNAGIWSAIIVSSVVFGIGHLPITGDVTAITPSIVVRAILLNGVAGIIFGWLYWKKGLESAIIAHFSADVVLHIILPVTASFFMG
jgi:membrane protease YdiL (CAAX protease family)